MKGQEQVNHKSINAKAQGREGAKKRRYLFASLRLRAFALVSCFILFGVLGGSAAAQCAECDVQGFPLPPTEVITIDNVARLQEIARIGFGVALDDASLPDGTLIVGSTAGVWQIVFDWAVIPLELTDTPIVRLIANPAGTLIAAGGEDGSIRLYDLTQGALIPMVYADHLYAIKALVFNESGTRLASADRSGVVRVWSVQGEQLTLESTDALGEGWSDLRFMDVDGIEQVEVLRVRSVISRLETDPDVFLARGFFPAACLLQIDSDRLIARGMDGLVRSWSLVTGQAVVSPSGYSFMQCPPDTPVTAVDSITGAVATGNSDGSITLTRTDGSQARFFGHFRAVSALAFTPDGSILFSGGLDRTVRAFDATIVGEAGELAHWEGFNGSISGLVVSDDGRTLIAAGADGVIRVYGVAG